MRTRSPILAALVGLSFGLIVLPAAGSDAPTVEQVKVGPGIWRPTYPAPGEEEIAVPAFMMDVRPVTNAEFLAFVERHPKWQRGKVPALFAGKEYLSHWAGPLELGDKAGPAQPVTYVSWWAARAYCEARGAHVPREAQWELAALASATTADASKDPAFLAELLAWYSRPASKTLPDAGSGPANVWGVRDLHGLVWEWVDDFQSALVVSDNREDGTVDTTRFCGASAIAAADKENYAAFMRVAFRSSLRAEYATSALGFRCANDLPPSE